MKISFYKHLETTSCTIGSDVPLVDQHDSGHMYMDLTLTSGSERPFAQRMAVDCIVKGLQPFL